MPTLFLVHLKEEETKISDQLKEFNSLNERLKKIRELIRDYNGTNSEIPFKDESSNETHLLDFPTEYDKELNQKQKIYIALYKIGRGTVDEVATSLVKIAPNEYTFEKAKPIAGDKLSFLYTKEIIGVEKSVGRKKKYKIKNTP